MSKVTRGRALGSLLAFTATLSIISFPFGGSSAKAADLRANSSRGANFSAISETDADKQLSPLLDPAERAFVKRHLVGLKVPVGPYIPNVAPEHIDTVVVDGRTNKIYYNRPQLHGSHAVGTYKFNAGSFAAPPSKSTRFGAVPFVYSATSNPSAGTGPYRRVFTQPSYDATNSATFGEISTAVFSCAANGSYNFNQPTQTTREAGEIYLGGWSATNSALDVGLQYNRGLTPASIDDYAPLMAISPAPPGSPQTKDTSGYVLSGQTSHIPCDAQTAIVSFSIQQFLNSPTVTFYATYVFYDSRFGYVRQINFLWDSFSTGPYAGWDPTCNGCVMKRMVSIAQRAKSSQGPGDVFSNGDYFVNAGWQNSTVSCGVFPGACQNGTYRTPGQYPTDSTSVAGCSIYPIFTMPYSESQRDCTNVDSPQISQVSSTNFSYVGESVNIRLTQGPTAPSRPTGISDVNFFIAYPTAHMESDGVHLGYNITNIQLPANSTIEFPNSGQFHYQVINSSGIKVFDNFAGKRFLSSLNFLTFAVGETKRDEILWTGSSPGQVYTLTATVNAYPSRVSSITFKT